MKDIKIEMEAIFGENNVSEVERGKKFQISKAVAESILNLKGNEDLKTLFVLDGDNYVFDAEKMFKGQYGNPMWAANEKDPSYNKKLIEFGADRARVAKVLGQSIENIQIDFGTGDLFVPTKLISKDYRVIEQIIEATNDESFSKLNKIGGAFGLSEVDAFTEKSRIKIHADDDGKYTYDVGDASNTTKDVMTHEDLALEIIKNLRKFNGISVAIEEINLKPQDQIKPLDRSGNFRR